MLWSLIPALRGLRQVGQKCEARQGYIVISRKAWAVKEREGRKKSGKEGVEKASMGKSTQGRKDFYMQKATLP